MTYLPIGAILKNRYKILDVLGTGGMSTVYLATDQQVGDVRAIYGCLLSHHVHRSGWLVLHLHLYRWWLQHHHTLHPAGDLFGKPGNDLAPGGGVASPHTGPRPHPGATLTACRSGGLSR